MKEVRMEKATLIERVQSNRDEHRGVYERAIKGYYLAVAHWLEVQQENLNTGEPFEVYFKEPRPEDHTADYDIVLDMLAESIDDEIVLTFREFQQYVRDDWGWKQDFVATSMSYIDV